jgi:hypothetical protein
MRQYLKSINYISFQFLTILNFFFNIYVLFVLSFLGFSNLTGEGFVVISLTTLLTHGLSFNSRNIYIGDTKNISFVVILRFRIFVGICSGIICSLIFFILFDDKYFYFYQSIMLVTIFTWIIEIILAKNEIEKKLNKTYFFLIVMTIILIPISIVLFSIYNLIILVLLYCFFCLIIFSRILNFSKINIAASFSKNIKQFRLGISSSFFKYISNLIWRYSILILIGSENAGMLFIAFSFGSFMGTMFDVSYGANLVNNFKKKINKYLIFIILYILISFICIYLFNYYSYLESQKLNLFNRTVVWSLVGGIFMINSLFIRQKLFKIKKFIQICFKLDLIGYLLITILIPILFIIDKAYLSFAYFVSSVFVFLIYGISFKILIK